MIGTYLRSMFNC